VAFFTASTATNEQPNLVLTAESPTGQTDIVLVLADNNVKLTEGDYLIRFGTTTVNKSNDIGTIVLLINGAQISITSRVGSANDTVVLTSEYLYHASADDTVGLLTALSSNISYLNTYLTIEKLS
jgi:hypothetical protein